MGSNLTLASAWRFRSPKDCQPPGLLYLRKSRKLPDFFATPGDGTFGQPDAVFLDGGCPRCGRPTHLRTRRQESNTAVKKVKSRLLSNLGVKANNDYLRSTAVIEMKEAWKRHPHFTDQTEKAGKTHLDNITWQRTVPQCTHCSASRAMRLQDAERPVRGAIIM